MSDLIQHYLVLKTLQARSWDLYHELGCLLADYCLKHGDEMAKEQRLAELESKNG